MPQDDLPGETGKAPDHAGITQAQVWQALDEYFHQEEQRPGDVTVKDIAEQYHISENSAQRRMVAICKAHPDKWEMLKVAAVNGSGKWVLRQLQTKTPTP